MPYKKAIAVLASGSGTNLQSIIDAINNKTLENTEIAIVISNKNDAYALKRAETNGIKTFFLNPKDFPGNLEYDKKLVEVISNYKVDLIILAGYMKILTSVFINAFSGKIINIHPSLLPAFGGKGMYGAKVHEAVLKSRIKESGCTVHYVTEEIDGGPVIAQEKVPVLKEDTVEILSKRVLAKEHELLVKAIKRILINPRHCEEARSADEVIS